MTDAPPMRARSRSRRIVLVAAAILAIGATVAGWLTVGDSGGCAADAPSVFSRAYRVSSRSMAPALIEGDWLSVERRYYCGREPDGGDLAVLGLPSHPGTVFSKRVIGLPGDRVQIQHGQLYLNGEPVRQDWLESTIHAAESGEAAQRTR